MKKETLHIRVGLFVFAALVVGMFIIFMIGSEKRVFQSHYTLKSTFTDISGLRIGAPVQLAGVGVGFVDNITFPRDLLDKKIEVELRVAKKFQDRIRDDSIATINTQGLLGDKYIFISIGSSDQPVLPDGGFIKTKEVVGLFDLAEKGSEILEDFQNAARSASEFFGGMKEGKTNIQEILASFRDVMKETEKGKGFLHALIYDPQGQEILNNISATMESVRMLVGDNESDGDRHKRMKSIAANINNAAYNLSQITDKINEGDGTVGGLINDPTIYNDIRSLFGRVNRDVVFKSVVRATLKENDSKVLK